VIFSGWFECLMDDSISPKVFKQQFRLSKSTFVKMVNVFTKKWNGNGLLFTVTLVASRHSGRFTQKAVKATNKAE
jgi:hypothetical protein